MLNNGSNYYSNKHDQGNEGGSKVGRLGSMKKWSMQEDS